MAIPHKLKPPRRNLPPGKILSEMSVVDEKGITRTVPKRMTTQQFAELIRRKVERQKLEQLGVTEKKKILARIPQTIQLNRLIQILEAMGFRREGMSQKWHHPKYGGTAVTAVTAVKKNHVLKKAIEDWLRMGNKI